MTTLQTELDKMYHAEEDTYRKMVLHNARIKLQCFEQLLAMHDAMEDSLELAHEIDEEMEMACES